MKKTFTRTIEIEVEVTGTYHKGSPAVPYLSNGDPGYPEEPDTFEIDRVELNGVDISMHLDTGAIAEEILENEDFDEHTREDCEE